MSTEILKEIEKTEQEIARMQKRITNYTTILSVPQTPETLQNVNNWLKQEIKGLNKQVKYLQSLKWLLE